MVVESKGVKIGLALLGVIIIFLVQAIIEALITIFMFKKYGGCPIKDKK